MSLSDDFADRFVSRRLDVNRFQEGARRKVVSLLKKLEIDLVKRIEQADITGVGPSFQRARQEKLLKQTRDVIAESYGNVRRTLQGDLIQLAQIEVPQTAVVMNATIGVDLVSVNFTQEVMNQLVRRNVVLGSPMEEWFDAQSRTFRTQFNQQIRLGVLSGESNQQLVQRIRGKSTGRRQTVMVGGKPRTVHVFKGGITDTSTRKAEAMVRTAVQNVSNNAQMEVYKQNEDIIESLEALVTLDAKTSDICMSRSGAVWTLEGKPTAQSTRQEPFPGPPPWHFQCRSILIPVLKPLEEIFDIDKKTADKLDRLSPSQQSSIDGQVSKKLTFEDWLQGKSKAFQDDKLGQGRAELWRDGKISMSDLIDQKGRSLTLEELRALGGS